jgi:transposase-like protein
MSQSKRKFTVQQKFEIVKEGLLSGAKVSEVCRRHGISTVSYYEWQKKFFDGALEGLRPQRKRSKNLAKEQQQQHRIKQLESVIVEITEENLHFKKKLGGSTNGEH